MSASRWRSTKRPGTFAWMRPNDLVWNFDILAWNADMPNMSGGLHADFAALFLDKPHEASGLTVLGTPVDLGKIDGDAYVVGPTAPPEEFLETPRSSPGHGGRNGHSGWLRGAAESSGGLRASWAPGAFPHSTRARALRAKLI